MLFLEFWKKKKKQFNSIEIKMYARNMQNIWPSYWTKIHMNERVHCLILNIYIQNELQYSFIFCLKTFNGTKGNDYVVQFSVKTAFFFFSLTSFAYRLCIKKKKTRLATFKAPKISYEVLVPTQTK